MVRIIPDQEALKNVRNNPAYKDKSDAEKYRLAQADTMLRLMKAENLAELERMAESGISEEIIREHNKK